VWTRLLYLLTKNSLNSSRHQTLVPNLIKNAVHNSLSAVPLYCALSVQFYIATTWHKMVVQSAVNQPCSFGSAEARRHPPHSQHFANFQELNTQLFSLLNVRVADLSGSCRWTCGSLNVGCGSLHVRYWSLYIGYGRSSEWCGIPAPTEFNPWMHIRRIFWQPPTDSGYSCSVFIHTYFVTQHVA